MAQADLHIHTVLSPCAELEMGPKAIVKAALDRSLNLQSITDHNAWANVSAVKELARHYGIDVFQGEIAKKRKFMFCAFS